MEADSTTIDNIQKSSETQLLFPFPTLTANQQFFTEFIHGKNERDVVRWLQEFGLIPMKKQCQTNGSECKTICKPARVIDRMQWVCLGCGYRMPVRTDTFFFKLQCSLTQILQMILAWCEDADLDTAAQHFGVKQKMAHMISNQLDKIAIDDYKSSQLGGEESVVLAEMYPECLNRLSPDTTEQPHIHRILMLADTKHIPTRYSLHVLKTNSNGIADKEKLNEEITSCLNSAMAPGSSLVVSSHVPVSQGTSMQALLQHCDMDMQRFLSDRIWRQAITLCNASRELCPSIQNIFTCSDNVQTYLDTSLYRLRYGEGFYQHMLRKIADYYLETKD